MVKAGLEKPTRTLVPQVMEVEIVNLEFSARAPKRRSDRPTVHCMEKLACQVDPTSRWRTFLCVVLERAMSRTRVW